MATLREIAQDPDFKTLPDSEKIKALIEIEPDLGGLSFNEQMKALSDLTEKTKEKGEGAFGLPRIPVELFPGGPKIDPLVTMSNIPSSAASYGKGLLSAITHPLETAKGIGEFVSPVGPIAAMAEGREPMQVSLLKNMAARYGTSGRQAKTIETDPIGTLADISSVIGGAGAAMGPKGAAVTKIASRLDPQKNQGHFANYR